MIRNVHPGSRGQKGPASRICNTEFLFLFNIVNFFTLPKRMPGGEINLNFLTTFHDKVTLSRANFTVFFLFYHVEV
jgi:hypothetical protein